MKQRFSSLDVKVIAYELRKSLVTLRISNIYELSSRIFLFKCAKPGTKHQLIVESGFRCHLTSFNRTTASQPSAFIERLRKYLKSRRITNVTQIGTDRVVEITFSDGQYRLFLEFFDAGNIILTDAELNVLVLWRQVQEGNEDVDVKLGVKYVLDAKQNFHGVPPISTERIKQVLEKQAAKFKAANEVGGKKAKRQKGGDELRKALSIGFPELSPTLLEHVFVKAGLDVHTKTEDTLQDSQLLDRVEKSVEDAGNIFRSLDTSENSKGYIIAKLKDKFRQDATDDKLISPPREALLYDDFHPFRPSQFDKVANIVVLEYDTFNKTVDEFFSSIESQQLESRLTEREEMARKKLQNAKNEHEKRLAGLQQAQELHIRKAQTIEANTHRVEEAISAVNGLVAQGMDWMDIGKLIENEQKRNNMVAQTIKLPLKLYENTVTLLLDEPNAEEEESDDEDFTDSERDSDAGSKDVKKPMDDKRLAIDVDLALSSWANARTYYEEKKTAAQKQERTVAASEMAFKSMEKKTAADLSRDLKQEKTALRPARRQFWFEKFLYFISSEGYLVLGGRDAQQNELLYRRHLKRGDVFVHADLHGASSIVVKNNPATPDAPIPPSTLSQAGALSVCSSSAWDSKAVMAAWWVNSDQVSKTAPTGEYLTTGGFVVWGQKNFLPPSQLLLGFGVYWLISEDSLANHGKNTIFRTESMVDGEAEALAADARGLNIDQDKNDDEETATSDEDLQLHDSVADVEEAADESVEEVKAHALVTAQGEHEDSESSDEENDDQRKNPLQTANQSDKPDEEVEISDPTEEQEEDSKKDPESGDGPDDSENESTTESNAPLRSSTPDKSLGARSSTPNKSSQPKRGANTKAAKRRAAKYALQDEEDRALAMELLGSNKAEQRRAAEAEAKAAREAKANADKERRRQQHAKAAEAEKARQERLAKREKAQQTQNVSGVEGDDEDLEVSAEQAELERKEHLSIARLVPAPAPGDELLAAVPVVAPWSALSRNKFKAKLQPGNMKKGKAVKEIVGGWSSLGSRGPKVVDETNSDKEKVWTREIECFKALKWEECVAALPVKGVRIVQGGGLAGASSSSGAGGKGKGGSARGGKGGKKGR